MVVQQQQLVRDKSGQEGKWAAIDEGERKVRTLQVLTLPTILTILTILTLLTLPTNPTNATGGDRQ
jgi:hypothetical protein